MRTAESLALPYDFVVSEDSVRAADRLLKEGSRNDRDIDTSFVLGALFRPRPKTMWETILRVVMPGVIPDADKPRSSSYLFTDTDLSVLRELADDQWDFRTLEGIASDTPLRQETVFEILEANSDFIRRSPVVDAHGRDLYTLSNRPIRAREVLSLIRLFLSKSPR